jgi:alanine dehydrogenase
MEAEVLLLDRDVDRLRFVDQIHRGRIMTLASNRGSIERVVARADLVIGAVLVTGERAPLVLTAEMVRRMRPGSVVIDVAVDQGGCFETTHETTHEDPTYFVDGVLHYAVGNIPAAVPYTSTYALTNATTQYIVALAERGTRGAAETVPALARGVNTVAGVYTNPHVAEAFGVTAEDPLEALAG